MAVINPGYVDVNVVVDLTSAGILNKPPKFPNIEMSREAGAPVSLYLFRWGAASSNVYAYTDAEEPITHQSVVYAPAVIGRSKIKASGSLDQSTLKIETTLDSEIAVLYLSGGPSYPTTLVIFQGHVGITDFRVVWSGRLVGLDPNGPLVEISAEPASTAMRGSGLRRHYMYGCPHVLYGKVGCRADSEVVKKIELVVAFGKADLDIASGWNGAIALEKYRNGYITWVGTSGQTEIRTIIDASATNLILNRKLKDVLVGTSLTIFPGCNHQVDDCADLHVEIGTGMSNIVNYGGQKDIPVINPIGLTAQYY